MKLLEISIATQGWKKIPHLSERLNKAAALTLKHLPKKFQHPCKVNLLLTSDAAIRRLNRDFRGFDKPTNVLSFPQFTPAQLTKMGKIRGGIELGDIAISYQYVVDEAKKDHKILINHLIHLMIHGLLHLFSYDHLSNSEAEKMERLERRIMSKLGLPDPYKIAVAVPARSRTSKRNRVPRQRTKT
ncbi:MAG: rRNA maturation RNase YbeY [Alphaproteobacteria bacterium]